MDQAESNWREIVTMIVIHLLKEVLFWATDGNRKSNVSFFGVGLPPFHGQEKLLLMTVARRYKGDGVKTLRKQKNSISGCRPWLKNVCA